MNALTFKRHLLLQRQGNAGGDTGGVGTGTNSGMSGKSSSSGGVGTSTSNYGSRQGFAGATSYGGGINGGNGGSIGDGTDSAAAAQQAARDAASAKAAADAAKSEAQIDALAAANPTVARQAIKDALNSVASANPNDPTASKEVSTNGFTYGQLQALSEAKLGGLTGINANNVDGQTVDQALASKNFNEVATKYAPMLPSLMGLSPVAMGVFTGIKGLVTGTTTIGGLAASLGMSAVAQQLGVSTATLSAMMAGNFGAAAANTATQGLLGAISKKTGVSGMLAGVIGKETGLTEAVASGISSAVNGFTGDTSTGFSIGNLASAIDTAMGTVAKDKNMTVQDITSKFDPTAVLGMYGLDKPSGGGAADTPGVTTTPGAAAEPQAPAVHQTYTRSSRDTPLADIYGAHMQPYNPFGDSMFQTPTEHVDALKYLGDSGLVAHAADGGSIEDILQYLRS